ncbi:MAG TPA: recombination protein NinG [Terracidiphilus sp.]|nr:recombination protein NinG [Terracidiphilus sp.]
MRKWRTHTRNEHSAAIERTDRAVSLMIRERDANDPCIACNKLHKEYDAGHYRRRELMPTRFHPMNLNHEGIGCNRGTHNNKYGMKDMDLYRENLDLKWGAGTAQFLYKLSQIIEPWETKELEQLRSAARMGPRVYEKFYFELRPHHQDVS